MRHRSNRPNTTLFTSFKRFRDQQAPYPYPGVFVWASSEVNPPAGAGFEGVFI